QALDDRRRANDLHADRMVSPSNRIADRSRALAARIRRHRPSDREEEVFGAACDLLHHFRRVPGKMPLQDLIDAVGVLKRRIARRRALSQAFGSAFASLLGLGFML